MLTIKHYKSSQDGKDIKTAANICIRKKLYVDGWCFWGWLNNPSICEHIFIAFNNNNPVGCCIILFDNVVRPFNFGIFVKEKYRRLGIGSRIIETALSVYPVQDICHGYGVAGSYEFFQKTMPNG